MSFVCILSSVLFNKTRAGRGGAAREIFVIYEKDVGASNYLPKSTGFCSRKSRSTKSNKGNENVSTRKGRNKKRRRSVDLLLFDHCRQNPSNSNVSHFRKINPKQLRESKSCD